MISCKITLLWHNCATPPGRPHRTSGTIAIEKSGTVAIGTNFGRDQRRLEDWRHLSCVFLFRLARDTSSCSRWIQLKRQGMQRLDAGPWSRDGVRKPRRRKAGKHLAESYRPNSFKDVIAYSFPTPRAGTDTGVSTCDTLEIG